MNQPGHCLCVEHREAYEPRNILPAWFVAPEDLRTVLFCGRCGNNGRRTRGGLVFGVATLENGLVQFSNHASYWLIAEELERRILIRDERGNAAACVCR